MAESRHVEKFQVQAVVRGGVIEWRLALGLEGGERVELPIRDGEEVPLLLDLLRRDQAVHYDPQTGQVSTGWSAPGAWSRDATGPA